MKEPVISGYKMVYRAPDETFDPKAYSEIIIMGMKMEENIYGPVFTARAIKHSLEFFEKKIGEKPPQNIKNLDELKEYLVSKSNKYSASPCVLAYGQVKTENELQGQTGAGTKLEMIDLARRTQKTIATAPPKINIQEGHVFEKLRTLFAQSPVKNATLEYGYKDNPDGSTEIFHQNCPLYDGCKFALDEGLLKRRDGRSRCGVTAFVCQMYKVLAGCEFDYECLEICKPECKIKIFMA